MDSRFIFAEQVSTLAVAGVVASGALSAPLAAVAVPLGVIGAIGASIWRRCPKRNCDRAVQAVLGSFARSPEFSDEMIDRASAWLRSGAQPIEFPPKLTLEAAELGGAENFNREMAQHLLTRLGLPDEDADLRPLLTTALVEAVAACRNDPEIRNKLTQDLLLEAAKQNKVTLQTVERIEKGVDEVKAKVSDSHELIVEMKAQLDVLVRQRETDQDAALDDLRDIAAELKHAKPHRAGWAELVEYIMNKVRSQAEALARIEAQATELGLDNLRVEIAELFAKRRYDEAEAKFDELIRMEEEEGELRRRLERQAFALEGKAAIALQENRVGDAFDLLSRAADSFAGIDPLEPARRRMGCANLLYLHGLRRDVLGLALAERMQRDALDALDRATDATLWAGLWNNLGIVLASKAAYAGGEVGAVLLEQAVEAYRAALQVRTRVDHPVDWAATQNNLGRVRVAQGSGTTGLEGNQLLTESVNIFLRVLQVLNKDSHPLAWAATQSNLGVALNEEGERTSGVEGTQLLGRAIDAYREALEVYSAADHQELWAATQMNIGNVLSVQGERTSGAEGAALLGLAIEAYSAALTFSTFTEHPLDWARIMENLAIAHLALADHDGCNEPASQLLTALEHVEAALEVYDPEHMPYNHEKATALRDRLRARLAEQKAVSKDDS